MRFESVTAHAFGPFRDQTLKLASGMNIVHGANESGKSSWHAALQAGLCGVKNKKGQPTKREKEFKRQRKPWHGTDGWDVEAVVALADGRRVELRHNLAAKSGHARDADVAGQDYSAEISDGAAPNGARWLGLSRASFLNTACVRQTEILEVREGADDLQDALARAADKAGKDVTAATALQLLADYRKNQVGSKWAPTKPLRLTQTEVSDAKLRLDSAKSRLEDYLRRQRDVKTLEQELGKHQRLLRGVQAHKAKDAASTAEQRIRRVRELQESVGEVPPSVTAQDADLANRIAAAIEAWGSAPPQPRVPQGSTCEELEGERLTVLEEQAWLKAAKPRSRPRYPALLSGLGLLAAAGTGLWMQTTVMMLVGVICSITGLGTIGWAFANGKRKAAEDRLNQLAELAKRLDSLEERIKHRRTADSAYRDDVKQWENARQKLHRAANATGIRESDATAQVLALRNWQDERLDRIADKHRRWGELQRERAGQSLEQIECEAVAKRKEADALLQDCGTAELNDALRFEGDLPARLEELQAKMNNARGVLTEFVKGMVSIADAEDDYEDATRRLHHLKTLDRTLEKATALIEQAQKGVYRDMAGVLRSTLLEWLPQVTGGRYTDCRVDPKTLLVEVREPQGEWRDASLLSHGTAEQVYLLLRLALCRHLVAENETCPLILDDPVSACDGHRQILVLETLLAISEETQVILFTHDDDVRDWGHRRLSDANNSQVQELPTASPKEPTTEHLGTRIANRFRGASLTEPIEELRGASVRPLDIS